jgi:hypothetical protein
VQVVSPPVLDPRFDSCPTGTRKKEKEAILASPAWIQDWWQDDQPNQVFREADEHCGDAEVQYDAEVI